MVTQTTARWPADIETMFEQLRHVDGKAELVDGKLVLMSPTGAWPAITAMEIAAALSRYSHQQQSGFAVGDNATFRVNLPHRQSFSPDAAYYVGALPDMGPFDGAPQFAVEVRSEGDYGPRVEHLLAEKRDDYFAAGTQVVWDVDLRSRNVIRAYQPGARNTPTIYRLGDFASAEPAVPGWTVPVADVLPRNWIEPQD